MIETGVRGEGRGSSEERGTREASRDRPLEIADAVMPRCSIARGWRHHASRVPRHALAPRPSTLATRRSRGH